LLSLTWFVSNHR
jgi:hypothetical protein